MFSFGILSSHLVYIIFIAVYAVYLCAYSINKIIVKDSSNTEQAKVITHKPKSGLTSNNYGYFKNTKIDNAALNSTLKGLLPKYHYISSNKYHIREIHLIFTHFQETLFYRPPPFFSKSLIIS